MYIVSDDYDGQKIIERMVIKIYWENWNNNRLNIKNNIFTECEYNTVIINPTWGARLQISGRRRMPSTAPCCTSFRTDCSAAAIVVCMAQFPDSCLTVEKKSRKTWTRISTRPRIEPGPAGWESTTLPLGHSDGKWVGVRHRHNHTYFTL